MDVSNENEKISNIKRIILDSLLRLQSSNFLPNLLPCFFTIVVHHQPSQCVIDEPVLKNRCARHVEHVL